MGILGGIFTVFSFLGISAILKENQKKQDFESGQKELKELTIERKSWFNEIVGKKGIVLLTGDSGIGKTYLLDQLLKRFENNNIDYYYEDSNYFFELNLDKMKKAEYVILDQFERALAYDNIYKNIQLLRNLNGQKIIIAVRSDYIGNIYKLLNYDNSINFVWLDYSKNEISEIKTYLRDLARITESALEKHELYSQILADIKQENLSMIQLSYLVKEIQYKGEIYVKEQLRKYTHTEKIMLGGNQVEKQVCDYDNVIIRYFKELLETCAYSKTAYIILFLLCLDRKGRFVNSMDDFQNITIQSDSIVQEVVKFLLDQNWIKAVKENKDICGVWINQYEISHDYLQSLFEKVCREQVASEIRSNIEYYNENCQVQRDSADVGTMNSWKVYTHKVCKRFLDSKNKIYTNIWLVFVTLFTMGISAYILMKIPAERDNKCITLAMLNFEIGTSIYYMYNYYYHFLTIFNWRYFGGIFLAAPVIMFPFIYMDYWAVSLGIEIIVVGIIMGIISLRVRLAEKSFFRTRFLIFCVIGFIVTFLGFSFKTLTRGNIRLTAIFYLLYGGYIIMSVGTHINRNYLLEIVGKVLYGGRRMKIK